MVDRAVFVDASMASVHLVMAHGVLVSPSTIRTWGDRGHISRLPAGKMRYELHEVVAHARAVGLFGKP